MSIFEFQNDKYTKGLWLMNEASGLSVVDASGLSHHGTAENATLTNGYFGKGWRIDANDEQITIPDHADWDLVTNGKYTWEFLLYPLALGELDAIWSMVCSGDPFFTILIGDYAAAGFVDVLWVTWSTSGTAYLVQPTVNNSLSINLWQYLAITYDGSLSQASRLNCYVNGINRNTGSTSVGTIGNLTSNSTIHIGTDASDNNAPAIYDSIRFRSGYCASALEIKREYAKLKGAYGVLMI